MATYTLTTFDLLADDAWLAVERGSYTIADLALLAYVTRTADLDTERN